MMSEEESVAERVEGVGQSDRFLDAVSRYIETFNENNGSSSIGGTSYGTTEDRNERDFSALLGPREGGLTISFRDVLVGMVLPHRSLSSTTTSSNVSSSPVSEEEPFYSPCICPEDLIDGGSENTGGGDHVTRCTSLEEYKCPICLDTFINTVRVDCSYGHKFCNFCIQCWINIGSHLVTECPVCRDPIFGKRLDLKTDAEIRSIVEQLSEAEKSERLLAIKERLQNEFPNVNFHEYPGVEFNGTGSNATSTEGTHQDLRSTLFGLGRATTAPVSGGHGFAGRCPFSSYPIISARNDAFSQSAPWTASSTSLSNGDIQGSSGRAFTTTDDVYQQFSSQTTGGTATGIWNSEVPPTSDDTFGRSANNNASWFQASGLTSNNATSNGTHQPSYAAIARSTSDNYNHNAFGSSSSGYFANRPSTAPNAASANQHQNPGIQRVTRSVDTSGFNPMTYNIRQNHSFPCYYPSPSAPSVMNTNPACGYQHHGCYQSSCHNHRSMSTNQLPLTDIGQIGHVAQSIPPPIQSSYAHGQLSQQQMQRSGDASHSSPSPNSSFWDSSSSTVVLNSIGTAAGVSSTSRLTPRMPGRHCMSFQLPRPVAASSSSSPPLNVPSPPDLNNEASLVGSRVVVSNDSTPAMEETNGHVSASQVGFSRPPGSGSCHHHHYHYIQNLEATSSSSPPNSSRPLPNSAGSSGGNGYGLPPPQNSSGRGTLRVAQYPNPSESAHFSGGFSLFAGGYIGFQINHVPMSVDDRVGPVPGRITHPLVSLVPLNSDGSSTRISLTFEVHRA